MLLPAPARVGKLFSLAPSRSSRPKHSCPELQEADAPAQPCAPGGRGGVYLQRVSLTPVTIFNRHIFWQLSWLHPFSFLPSPVPPSQGIGAQCGVCASPHLVVRLAPASENYSSPALFYCLVSKNSVSQFWANLPHVIDTRVCVEVPSDGLNIQKV
jgi:hypothetical protein